MPVHGDAVPRVAPWTTPYSYRDPLSRQGAPSADERQIAESSLNGHFYRILLDNSDKAQFVVNGNNASPFDPGDSARVRTFVGREGSGAGGFFLV